MTTVEYVRDAEGDIISPVRKLFADRDCRGLAQRVWEFERWQETFGSFGCSVYAHAWEVPYTHRHIDHEVTHCQAAILHASLSCNCPSRYGRHDPEDCCQCVGGTLHRGACQYCDWEGPRRASERFAIEDAMDHAWPGWRDLPILDDYPEQTTGKAGAKKLAKWWEQTLGYPEGWIAQGGPILTRRTTRSTRHHYGWGHPHGAWNMCGEVDESKPCGVSQGGRACTGLSNGGCISDFCVSWYAEIDEEDY